MFFVRDGRLAGSDQRLEEDLEILHVRRRALVQDHEIDRELLQPPVFVGPQKLADDGDVIRLVDLDDHDGNVTGDSMSPQ